ncbi:MAG TPA: AraC family transcriptional regulator, partial [Polyangia bacterium]|nr:AraC family transcriptional regulator [Polyangia bacterium]
MQLIARMERHAPTDGEHQTKVAGLALFRQSRPQPAVSILYEPALCIIVRGEKHVTLADERYIYGPGRFLLIAANLPVTAEVREATPRKPYLGLRLSLDAALVAEVVAQVGPSERQAAPARALVVSRVDEALLDSVGRLLALLDSPRDQSVLTPLVMRELTYRLLVGEQGARLRQIAAGDGQAQRVTRALRWLGGHYAEPLRIEELARHAGMSPSALHHHFKSVTAMSPLQYQKSLRLREARRLMLAGLDAAEASFRVGYE